jgi:hypothetical protein
LELLLLLFLQKRVHKEGREEEKELILNLTQHLISLVIEGGILLLLKRFVNHYSKLQKLFIKKW